jgi:hypothetical protein
MGRERTARRGEEFFGWFSSTQLFAPPLLFSL